MSSEEQDAKRASTLANTELFTLRLWNAPAGKKIEWRGRLQFVRTGQVRYFRDWETLIACLEEMLLNHGRRSR